MKHSARVRAGFTIIELLVAIGLSAVMAVGLYSLSMVAAQTFNQQQRVSEVQLRLRNAMEVIRSDASRAGFMATPASSADPMVCPLPSTPVQGVFLERDLPNPTFAPTDNSGITPVHLQLTGDYVNTDEFRVMGINGVQIMLQNHSWAYAQRVPNAQVFQQLFLNRTIRIMGTNGSMQFNRVTGVNFQPATGPTLPVLTVATAPIVIGNAGAGCGITGLGVGATVAPITTVSYRIAAATNDFNETGFLIAGKTDLIREEMQPNSSGVLTPIVGTRRAIAEFAVDFEVAALVDSAITGAVQPTLTRYLFDQQRNYDTLNLSGSAGSSPQRVRSLTVRLSVRDRIQDPDFGWTARVAGQPLTRFRLMSTQSGAARVRSLTAEIELPNIASRNLR